VEPSPEDIYKSCKLALAFEKLLDEEDATVLTVDCYGTMWDRTIKLPAYPCLGFARLNNLGLGGICESDLRCAMVHIILQGLVGRPGFISDPTVDSSKGSIILAHCMGTPKMAGPGAPAAPYKIRTVMERREGVVPQVEMRVGQKVTQALLADMDTLRYFTGEIIESPVGLEADRGCRTKIDVRVDGDIAKLWQNWTAGLHRQTVYGDVTQELGYFCRFKDIKLVNEAA
jgi:L-fucose isomerase-like protein